MNKTNYGIIGDGFIATHFAHYLKLTKISFTQWSRKKDSENVNEKLSQCNTILLLISDDSIENFIIQNPKLEEKTLIHFSGSLTTPKAIGFHPLMTFVNSLYSLEKYQSIPFIGIKNSKEFNYYFPELKNSYYAINENQKSQYHSLCVLSGNLTTLLWQKATKDFEEELNLPKEILNPYLEQVCTNIKEDPFKALTGPIKRQDKYTIKRNRKALKSRIWSNIYRLFDKVYREELR